MITPIQHRKALHHHIIWIRF